MTFKEFIAYMRTIAENHKEILHTENERHFYRMDIEEAISGLRNGVEDPAMIMEHPEGELTDRKDDNPMVRRTCAFMILKQVPGLDDFDAIEDALDSTERIALDIISKLWNDSKKRVLKYPFDLDGTQINKVGPILDNRYGWRVVFRLNDKAQIFFDVTKWNNETNYQ